ncbi:MAG: phosphoribosylanthranilate isomerase [Actinomycetota bacterium]|nr:phosphoribosylanthranilate isomerase [Actinomycetota bacterium]MEC9059885.1 phosphoribosylanthranilate isomerase [Actinomycetota bacterium]MEC9473165.1 phosphoribosylanthranilate isomerase [Actinomycetota bacterium]
MFVKICGVTTEEDALLAVGMGADALGFNFVPGSSRQIRPAVARDIARRLPGGILTVGIFKDELKETVIEVVHTAGLQAAQLHGRESTDDSMWIAERVPYLIKAFAAGESAIDRLDDYGANAVLVDAPEPGSGEVFDWSMLDGRERGRPLILAGGLNPENVAQAVHAVKPWGVDVASGVEASPGVKDPVRVREFILAARQAGDSLESTDKDFDPEAPRPYDWRDE